MLACMYLGDAIHNRDVEGVQRAASDAAEAWLAMRAMLRRRELAAAIAGDPGLALARSATCMYRRTMADLFDRAQEQIGAASLHPLLAQLRLNLAIANDELTSRADARGSGDRR
jgi:hypothetical protein